MAPISPDRLVSLPSLSCSLSSLPQARSIDSVSLHPTMYAQRAAESEAKLRQVLSKTASLHPSQQGPPQPYAYPPREPDSSHSQSSSPPLMMRTRPKIPT